MTKEIATLRASERIIDDVISTMRGDLTVPEVYSAIRSLCARQKQLTWFESHFTYEGWTAMIKIRLVETGYVQYPNRIYLWHRTDGRRV